MDTRGVVVTGGTGFLGQAIAQVLSNTGWCSHVVQVGQSDYDLLDDWQAVRLCRDNIATSDTLIHAAALVGGIGANQANPVEFFRDNMLMGMNVLEAARLSGFKKVVMIGTTCEYPKRTPVPFHESDLWNGYPEGTNAPYGIAKRALLTLGQAYREQCGLDVIHLLPANLYGPGDNFNPTTGHVIPGIIHKLAEAERAGDKTVTLWGTGEPTREFLYVHDCAEAIVAAAYSYSDARPLNIGTGQEISIREMAYLIRDLMGLRHINIEWDPTKPDGQPRRSLSVSRIESEVGWKANTTLEDGLRATLQWYEDEVRAQ